MGLNKYLMLVESSYSSCLLVAHPLRDKDLGDDFRKSVFIVMRHDAMGAVGLRINQPFPNGLTLTQVMRNMGLSSNFDHESLYQGGQYGSNRVFVVHTLDWYTAATIKFPNNLGISSDVSIISAISQGEGPEYFRAVAGFNLWDAGELEQEVNDTEDIQSSWICVPSSADLIFEVEGHQQWKAAIDVASKIQVAQWF
jgi:putative transcriptional regulator